jgi:hypothetical protein
MAKYGLKACPSTLMSELKQEVGCKQNECATHLDKAAGTGLYSCRKQENKDLESDSSSRGQPTGQLQVRVCVRMP